MPKNPYLTSAYSQTNFVLEKPIPYHTLHVGSLKSSFEGNMFNVDDDKLPFTILTDLEYWELK
jgi:hypothetical protein